MTLTGAPSLLSHIAVPGPLPSSLLQQASPERQRHLQFFGKHSLTQILHQKPFRAVVLNLWVATPLGVAYQIFILLVSCIRSKIKVMKYFYTKHFYN